MPQVGQPSVSPTTTAIRVDINAYTGREAEWVRYANQAYVRVLIVSEHGDFLGVVWPKGTTPAPAHLEP